MKIKKVLPKLVKFSLPLNFILPSIPLNAGDIGSTKLGKADPRSSRWLSSQLSAWKTVALTEVEMLLAQLNFPLVVTIF